MLSDRTRISLPNLSLCVIPAQAGIQGRLLQRPPFQTAGGSAYAF